jgi:hypothetical protein
MRYGITDVHDHTRGIDTGNDRKPEFDAGEAFADPEVQVIERRCLYANEDISGANCGSWDLFEDELIQPSVLMNSDAVH